MKRYMQKILIPFRQDKTDFLKYPINRYFDELVREKKFLVMSKNKKLTFQQFNRMKNKFLYELKKKK